MNQEQIEEQLDALESMPIDEFNQMIDWFAAETRRKIFARIKAGTYTDEDTRWLFEHREPSNFPIA